MAVTILSKTRGRPVIGTNRSDYSQNGSLSASHEGRGPSQPD